MALGVSAGQATAAHHALPVDARSQSTRFAPCRPRCASFTEAGKIRPILEERLQAALRTAHRYPESPIVVTGGVPRNDITEVRAMKDWLVARGIPPERITEETRSTSTVENARFTNTVLLERRATGAVLVTNRDHLRRAMINFRQAVDARISIAGIVAAQTEP